MRRAVPLRRPGTGRPSSPTPGLARTSGRSRLSPRSAGTTICRSNFHKEMSSRARRGAQCRFADPGPVNRPRRHQAPRGRRAGPGSPRGRPGRRYVVLISAKRCRPVRDAARSAASQTRDRPDVIADTRPREDVGPVPALPAVGRDDAGSFLECMEVSAGTSTGRREWRRSKGVKMVGAGRFELPTPGPPDRCANQATLRSEPSRHGRLGRPVDERADYTDGRWSHQGAIAPPRRHG